MNNDDYPSLDEYIRMRVDESDGNPFTVSPFKSDGTGAFINPWLSGFSRISFFARARGVMSFASDTLIDVYVPATDSGIEPLASEEQPYSWDGPISPYAVEQALWHAFELLTQAEADEFMALHKPCVVFKFLYHDKLQTLAVKFDGSQWVVIDSDD